MAKRKCLEGQKEELAKPSLLGDFRSFHDSVHGHIKMDPLLVAIIDTPQYQRLRDLKQLGMAYWVFPGASHNRFEHGIGTSYLCGLMLSTLKELHEKEPKDTIKISDTEILCIKIAGLCHDLGHGPFSHAFDKRFIKMAKPEREWTHEEASCQLFDHMIDNNEDLKEMMEKRGIDDSKRDFIKSLIEGQPQEKDEFNRWFLYEIVSNKRTGIDCDKFDYFARDAHHLGLKYSFDFNRYFQNIRILDYEGQLRIGVRDKEMFNIYELFHIRWALHHQVYQHKTVSVLEEMVCRAMEKVDDIFHISLAIDDMQKYTLLTDSIIFEIFRSQNSDQRVAEAKEILSQIQKRKQYRFCGQTNPKSTAQKLPSCDKVKKDILKLNQSCKEEDIFVDIISINYGMKSKNPVENVLFFSKDGKIGYRHRDLLSDIFPQSFAEQHIRVYSTTDEKRDIVKKAFKSWCEKGGFRLADTLEVEQVDNSLIPKKRVKKKR